MTPWNFVLRRSMTRKLFTPITCVKIPKVYAPLKKDQFFSVNTLLKHYVAIYNLLCIIHRYNKFGILRTSFTSLMRCFLFLFSLFCVTSLLVYLILVEFFLLQQQPSSFIVYFPKLSLKCYFHSKGNCHLALHFIVSGIFGLQLWLYFYQNSCS